MEITRTINIESKGVLESGAICEVNVRVNDKKCCLEVNDGGYVTRVEFPWELIDSVIDTLNEGLRRVRDL